MPAYNASQTETQSYGGRTRQEASVEGDKVAEAFDLVLKPLAYDVVTMSSFAVTAAMTGGGGKFDERDLVALEPADWHDQEVRIGPGLGFGSKLLLVKWMDGRDAAIIAKDVLGHLSDNVKAEADASIMAATKCALQERGDGAFEHLDTKGVLTPTANGREHQEPWRRLHTPEGILNEVHLHVKHQQEEGRQTSEEGVYPQVAAPCDQFAQDLDSVDGSSCVGSAALQVNKAGFRSSSCGTATHVNGWSCSRNTSSGSQPGFLCMPRSRSCRHRSVL